MSQHPGPSRFAKLLAFTLAMLFLVGAEIVCRLNEQPTHLQQILALLRRDPVLFWRVRPNLRTTFAGVPVWTDERGLRIATTAQPAAGLSRVLCLGASPTFGWGVKYEQTYTRVLADLSREAGRPIEAVNGGQIGFSSHQGRLLFERELADTRPDVVTIAFVINDIDKYRFFRSDGRPDRLLMPENKMLLATADRLERSGFYRWFAGRLRAGGSGRQAYAGMPVRAYRPQSRRVPPDDYAANLTAMIDLARARGIVPVLIALPVHLPVGEIVSAAAREQATAAYELARTKIAGDDCAAALPLLQQALAADANLSEAHYEMGVCLHKAGRSEAAAAAFAVLMKSEARRCGRDGVDYNRRMAQVAAKRAAPLVDVVAAFAAAGSERLFLTDRGDPIHPNAAGHRLIGELLARTLFEQNLLPARTRN